ARRLGAGMILAGDLVEDRRDLAVVVFLGGVDRAGDRILLVFHVGFDLRRIEVIDAIAARTLDQIVGRIFVGPGGISAGGLDHVEDRVYANIRVRIGGRAAIGGIARQLLRIEAAAGIDLVGREIEGLVVIDFGAGL